MEDYVEVGLKLIAHAIQAKRGDQIGGGIPNLLTDNSGLPPFETPVFSMRSFCWCDGNKPGHEAACPPNFEHHRGFRVEWYKHLGRGNVANSNISPAEWFSILNECLTAIEEAS